MKYAPLSIWTLYENPKDYPGEIVARRWENDKPTGDVLRFKSEHEADAHFCALGFVFIDRDPSDDAVILGTYI